MFVGIMLHYSRCTYFTVNYGGSNLQILQKQTASVLLLNNELKAHEVIGNGSIINITTTIP